MHYLALRSFAQHVERIKIRADKGGHDNGDMDTKPRVLLQAEGGHVVYIGEQWPEWLEQALVEL